MISDKMDHSEKYYAVGLSLSGLVFEISANYEHPLFLPIKRLWYFYSCKKNYEKFSLIFFVGLLNSIYQVTFGEDFRPLPLIGPLQTLHEVWKLYINSDFFTLKS